MPQMMPLNWVSLLFYFLSILFLIVNLNYYLTMYKMKNINTKMSFMTKNWKW